MIHVCTTLRVTIAPLINILFSFGRFSPTQRARGSRCRKKKDSMRDVTWGETGTRRCPSLAGIVGVCGYCWKGFMVVLTFSAFMPPSEFFTEQGDRLGILRRFPREARWLSREQVVVPLCGRDRGGFLESRLAHRFVEGNVVADVLPRPGVLDAVHHDRLYGCQRTPFACNRQQTCNRCNQQARADTCDAQVCHTGKNERSEGHTPRIA